MTVAGCTDKGIKRNDNQDSFIAEKFNDEIAWSVVCDGMGGANAGNLASSEAVNAIAESLKNGLRKNIDDASLRRLIDTAIYDANISVFDISRSKKELNGMGTTVVVAIAYKNTVYISHAGDSRAYLIYNGSITQVTKDHSIAQSMIENGKLTKSEARYHPSKNVITRALGIGETLDADFDILDFPDSAILLICTDGLTNYVENIEILKIITQNDIDKSVKMLIERANANGGGDNITAVLIDNN